MIPQVHSRWLLAVIVALLLGGQIAQSAHIHADNHFASDCAQCHLDSGKAVTSADSTTPYLPASTTVRPAVLAAPVVRFYRPTARGPPALSI